MAALKMPPMFVTELLAPAVEECAPPMLLELPDGRHVRVPTAIGRQFVGCLASPEHLACLARVITQTTLLVFQQLQARDVQLETTSDYAYAKGRTVTVTLTGTWGLHKFEERAGDPFEAARAVIKKLAATFERPASSERACRDYPAHRQHVERVLEELATAFAAVGGTYLET